MSPLVSRPGTAQAGDNKQVLNTELTRGGRYTLVHPLDDSRYLRNRTNPKERLGYSDSLEICEALQFRSFQTSEQSWSFQKAVYRRQMLRLGLSTRFSVGTGAFLRQILRCLRNTRMEQAPFYPLLPFIAVHLLRKLC